MGDVQLRGQDVGKRMVPIYDTCDEVRRKTKMFLKRARVNQARFLRGLGRVRAGYNRDGTGYDKGTPVSKASFEAFMRLRGPSAGSESIVFYLCYVFFEKLRIKEGKPKSELREEMEELWGNYKDAVTWRRGFLLKRKAVVCRQVEEAVEDKYGMVRVVPKGMTGGRRGRV